MEKISATKKGLPSKIRAFLKTSTSSKEVCQGEATIIKQEPREIFEETGEAIGPILEEVAETNEIVPEQAPGKDQGDHTYFAQITCKVCHTTYSARSKFIVHNVAVHLMDQRVNKKPTIFITYSRLRHKHRGRFINF